MEVGKYYILNSERFNALIPVLQHAFKSDKNNLKTIYLCLGYEPITNQASMKNLTTGKIGYTWGANWFILSKKHNTRLGKILYKGLDP